MKEVNTYTIYFTLHITHFMYENMYDVYKQKVVTETNKKVKNTRL